MEAEAGREAEDKEEVAGVELAGNAALEQLQRPGEQEAEDGATSAEDMWVACAVLARHLGGHPAPEARRRPGDAGGSGDCTGDWGLGKGAEDCGRNSQGGRRKAGRTEARGGGCFRRKELPNHIVKGLAD